MQSLLNSGVYTVLKSSTLISLIHYTLETGSLLEILSLRLALLLRVNKVTKGEETSSVIRAPVSFSLESYSQFAAAYLFIYQGDYILNRRKAIGLHEMAAIKELNNCAIADGNSFWAQAIISTYLTEKTRGPELLTISRFSSHCYMRMLYQQMVIFRTTFYTMITFLWTQRN